MLFICKLNPVTTEEDLEIIFSRFGNVTSCDIIRCAAARRDVERSTPCGMLWCTEGPVI